MLYDRFTQQACKALQVANQQAQFLNYPWICREHLLLALIRLSEGIAGSVISSAGLSESSVLSRIVPGKPNSVAMGRLPQNQETRRTVEYAIEEARGLDHNYVGTEHLLLGLLRESTSAAADVLRAHGLTLESCRKEVARQCGNVTAADKQQVYRTDVSHTPVALAIDELQRFAYSVLSKHGLGASVILWEIAVDAKTGKFAVELKEPPTPTVVAKEETWRDRGPML